MQPNTTGVSINPRKEPLTIEKFKELTGQFEMSDQEAQEYVWQIEALCAILMEAVENNTEK
ncbi:MAG: hypothetical protein EPN85_07825 [Bacteroidetes bacterium]|nr:MAG: hypothetical protein EPN85_07825 [Bacteroidota bacterium]